MDSTCDVSIVPHFKDLKDPRIERAKKHRLIDIIVIALGSIMVGGDGFQDMELFGRVIALSFPLIYSEPTP